MNVHYVRLEAMENIAQKINCIQNVEMDNLIFSNS